MNVSDRFCISLQENPPPAAPPPSVTKAVRLAIGILCTLGTILLALLPLPYSAILLSGAVMMAAYIEPLKEPILLPSLKPLYSPARPCRFHIRLLSPSRQAS